MDNLLSLIYNIRHDFQMNYNSLIFFVCLMLFVVIYFFLRSSRAKMIGILFANIVFYTWAGSAALLIVLGTAVIVYVATRIMERIYEKYNVEKQGLKPKEQVALLKKFQKKTKKILLAAMVLILGIWIYVKIGKLIGQSTVDGIKEMLTGKGLIVPIGISYYTLSAVGYMLDIYWRKGKATKNFLELFTVMIYFPHIVQGPISKYTKLLEQFKNIPKMEYNRVCMGLQLMIWGYIKKIIIADRLNVFTMAVFGSPDQYAGLEILFAIILCVFQLYADFSGCMDIVRGISQALGIELEQNFRQPFYSTSGKEFWTRWHITLGAWTKEYIYLPIAMNPKFMKITRNLKKSGKEWLSSFIKALAPLIAVWIFTGLWHGTGYDYLVWGLYWCTIMTLGKELTPLFTWLEKIFRINKNKTYFILWQRTRTFFVFGIGRTFTITGALSGCVVVWKQLFSELRLWVLFDGSLYTHGLDQKDFYIAILGIIALLIVDNFHEKGIAIRERIAVQPLVLRWTVYYIAMLLIVIFGVYGPGFDASAFVYGAF